MKTLKLWIALGFTSFIIGIVLFIYSVFIREGSWKWQNFKSYEVAVTVPICVGIALIVVVAVEHYWKKYTNK